MSTKKQITTVTHAFTKGLTRILGNNLHAVYVYGAAAFPDNVPTGDIDFHVILNQPLSATHKQQLKQLHKQLAADYPPLGAELDGYYLLLSDATKTAPPSSQLWTQATDKSWPLHREHILAGRCIILFGPDPKTMYKPATWKELHVALDHELQFVEDHINKYPDYCILNLCRLLYSHETKQVVVSKAQAAKWGEVTLPQWQSAITMAKKSYAGTLPKSDRKTLISMAHSLLKFAKHRLDDARKVPPVQ